MPANRSAPAGDIVPTLIYHDLAKAIDWLCRVFGFQERLRVTGQDGRVGHAQLAVGHGGVLLSESRTGQGFANAPDTAVLRPPRPGEVTQSLMVHVEDVDRHYEHAVQQGAQILSSPASCPFGERQYTAEDLGGHRWTFSQTIADVAPESWGATVSAIRSPRWCYLEIPAIDVHRSAAFYEKVFGWNIRQRDSDRPGFDDTANYLSGAFVSTRPVSREPGLLPHLLVDHIEDVLALIVASGGEAVHQKTSEGLATFRDPAGNLVGLYQQEPR